MEVNPIAESGDSTAAVLPANAPTTHPRRRREPDAGAPPNSADVIGTCDRCGTVGELVTWRVHLEPPHAVVLQGICARCQTDPAD